MIPRGRPTYETTEVQRVLGISPGQWQRGRKAEFTSKVPALPGMERPELFDKAQTDAYAQGKPIPALPDASEEHPDDLLTEDETAAVLGIKPGTLRGYIKRDEIAWSTERHERRWWTRADAEERRDHPGIKPSGRPVGAVDHGPRKVRADQAAAAERAQQLAADVAAAAAGHREPLTAAEIAQRFHVTAAYAEKLLTQARRSAVE